MPQPDSFDDSERYEVLRALGSGGAGKVFLVRDRESGEELALKKLQRVDQKSVLRFKREFRSLADLHHPNLIRLYELGLTPDGCYFTMEHVEGRNLSEALAGSASTARLVDVFHQLASAIRAIHHAGLLHRDLKPSNVLVTHTGRVVVLDFGLVRDIEASSTFPSQDGQIAGTPAYMAPEQARAVQLTEASDWYAFGVMLYETLCGRLPIVGRNNAQLLHRKIHEAPAALPRELSIPARLRELCMQLVQPDPAARPSGEHVAAELSALTSEPTVRTFTEELGTDTTHALSKPPLFGRERELSALRDAFGRMHRHRSVVAHVRGPSGAGKSALIEAFLEDPVLATADALVLRSRCYEREAMPFKALDGVIDTLVAHMAALDPLAAAHILPRDIGYLARLFPAFERLPVVSQLRGKRAGIEATEARQRGEHMLRELIERIAEQRALVIWIDDLQWGDLDSASVIQSWLRPTTDVPLLLIFSYRSEEIVTSPCLKLLLGVESSAIATVVDVSSLSDESVRKLCSERFSGRPAAPPRLIDRVVHEARGNPFLAQQLVALALVKQARGEVDQDSLSLEELVLRTIALLAPEARAILNILAIAGRPLPSQMALSAAEVHSNGRSHVHALQSLRLVRTRIVTGQRVVEVYHDRIREGVQAVLSPSELSQLHARLLRVLTTTQLADPAWLHELALGAGERAQARRYGLLAAKAASASLAFERAADLYERCVQLTEAGDETAELWKELALARVRCRRGAQAADAYLEASKLATAAERIELMKLAASHLLRSGRFDEGEHLVQQVLAELKLSVPGSTAGLYAAIGWEKARCAVLEHVSRPRSDASMFREEHRIGMLYAYLALDTQCYAPLRATLFQMRAVRLCFQSGDASLFARAFCLDAALSSLSADSAAGQRVDKLLARAQALISDDSQPATKLELYSARALSAMLLGRLPQVVEPARAAEALYTSGEASGELGDYFYMFVVRSTLVSALQFLGRHNEAAEAVRAIIERAHATDNRCAVLQSTTVRTGVEQVEDCCRDSRVRLDAERSALPKHEISVLHVLHLLAVLRAACMTSDYDWAFEIYTDLAPKIAASPLQRGAYLMCLLHTLHARFVLNHHVDTGGNGDPARLIREDLSWLENKAPVPFRKFAALRLRARLAAIGSNHEQAKALLELCSRAHEERGAIDEAARDRYALGLLIGGEDGSKLQTEATTALLGMGVRFPARDIRAYYPELARQAHTSG